MVDIDAVVKKATQKARETERLPDFNRRDAASLQTLRKRNYPTNRGMHDYFEELPVTVGGTQLWNDGDGPD